MLRTSTSSLSAVDAKAILASLDLGRAAQCLSLHPSQRLLAVGLLHEIRVVRVDISTSSPSFKVVATETHPKQNVHVTDLAWCPHNATSQHRLAVAYTNGEIKVFSLSPSLFAQWTACSSTSSSQRSSLAFFGTTPQSGYTTPLRPDWVVDRGEVAESRHCVRLRWHPRDAPATLYCACVDGAVRAFVTERDRERERDGERERESQERPERERDRDRERTHSANAVTLQRELEREREREREKDKTKSNKERERERDSKASLSRSSARGLSPSPSPSLSSHAPFSTKACNTYKGRRSAVRDIAFSPFADDVFADCSDSGVVRVWDRRVRDKPLLSTRAYNTHKGRALAVAWCPYRDGVLASGGSDKSVKVWDTLSHNAPSQSSSSATTRSPPLSLALSPSHNATTQLKRQKERERDRDRESEKVRERKREPDASLSLSLSHTESSAPLTTETAGEPSLLSTLSAQGEVHRVLWGLSLSGSAYLVSSCADTAGTLSLWSEDKEKRHVPHCALRGHGAESVVDVCWMDVPHSVLYASHTLSHTQTHTAHTARPPLNAATQRSAALPLSLSVSLPSASSVSLLARNGNPSVSSLSSPIGTAEEVVYTRALLSLSREGRLLLQAPLRGVRPWAQLPRCVACFSTQGDCALSWDRETERERDGERETKTERDRERELVFVSEREMERERERENDVDLVDTNAFLSLSALYRDTAASLSLTLSSQHEREREGESRRNRDDDSHNSLSQHRHYASHTPHSSHTHTTEREKGRVRFIEARLQSLHAARALRSECSRAAEGGAFDAAVVALLAKNYSFSHPLRVKDTPRSLPQRDSQSVPLSALSQEDEEHERKERFAVVQRERERVRARNACTRNLSVAQRAGLQCRAAVWSAVLAVLPRTTPSLSPSLSPCTTIERERQIKPAAQWSIAVPLVAQLLQELQDGGDAQHFVALCEILRGTELLAEVRAASPLLCATSIASRRLYLAYTELLTQMQLHNAVCAMRCASDDEILIKQSRGGTEIALKCARCRKEVPKRMSTTNADSVGTSYCGNCKRTASVCSLCLEPVQGLLQWCVICAHGGHLQCMRTWFKSHSCCPAGCGHDCGVSCGVNREREKERDGFVARDAVQETLQSRRRKLRRARTKQLIAALQ